ncbi:MAG TPA: antibiotic biosynthesis monooxygenase [Candidatus Nitrosotalea sp.]|nr:antibiotic biosynthesis monooxygenase [Candidatus Nitrosotalea sp.]
MEQITITVQYKIKKKKLAKAIIAILEYVEAIKKTESGTTEYKVFQDESDRTVFIHIMSFVDKAAKKTHEKSEDLKNLKKILVPISKGKAVYASMVTVQPPTPIENIEIKKDMSSHEPI